MDSQTNVAELVAGIISSYVSNNEVARDELPKLIHEVFQSFVAAMNGKKAADDTFAGHRPAVSVKKTIFPDYLVCLEDGKHYKSLKRHLRSSYNLTPEAYREKWGLAHDYAMVAPNYALKRSSLAKSIGLGKKPKNKVALVF